MNGIWKKTLKMLVHDVEGFVMDEEFAEISRAVGEMACIFNLGVDEDEIEDLLEEVPEELTNEKWKKKQEKKKETAAEEKEELQRKFIVKGLAETFADLNKLLEKFENMDPNTKRFSLIERNVLVHYLLTS
jgi:transcription termination factor NusB